MNLDLKKHPVMFGMLVFTVLFYLFLYATSRARGPEGSLTRKAHSVTVESVDSRRMDQREERFKENLLARPRLLRFLSLVGFSIFFTGLAVEFNWFLQFLQKRSPIEGTGRAPGSCSWGLTEIFQLFIGLFFVEACLLSAELTLSFWVRWSESAKDFLVVFNGFVRDVLVAVWVVALVTRLKKAPLSSLGLTRNDFFKNLRTGFCSYWGMVPVLLALLFMTSALVKIFSYEPPTQAVVEIYLKKSTEHFIVFFTLFVAVLGPIFEEIFFRGFAYTALRARFGASAAMILTALVFSALHLNLTAFLPIFFLGIFLAYLYEKTGSLVPSMTAHVLHNVIMVGLTLGFKSLSA